METAILSEVGQYASLKLSWSNLRTSFKLSGFRVFARDSMTSLNQFCPGTERNFFNTYLNLRPLRFICADIVFKLRLSMPIGGKSIGRSGVVDHTSFISSPEEIRYTLRITGMLKKYGTHDPRWESRKLFLFCKNFQGHVSDHFCDFHCIVRVFGSTYEKNLNWGGNKTVIPAEFSTFSGIPELLPTFFTGKIILLLNLWPRFEIKIPKI